MDLTTQIDPYNIKNIRQIFAKITDNYSCDFGGNTLMCQDLYAPNLSSNGQTGFLRHRGVMRLLTNSLKDQYLSANQPLKILAAPSSIGCEAYALSAFALSAGLDKQGFQIDAFDRSETFTALARLGSYPYEMAYMVDADWRDMFFDQGIAPSPMVNIREDVKDHVCFIEPQPFETFKTNASYDVVMVNNLFMYLDASRTSEAMNTLNETGAKLIITTADRGAPESMPQHMLYISAADHPYWKKSELISSNVLQDKYRFWARLEI
jgi:chemotaxis methyl-accepting protein methylase